MTRVSPAQNELRLQLAEVEVSDWGDEHDDHTKRMTKQPNGFQNGVIRTGDSKESTVRRRRRRSFEPGSDEYAAYVEKRVFNKMHAWTPYLWERKR